MKLFYKFISYLFKSSTKAECHNTLIESNIYYKGLSHEKKNTFLVRTLIFRFRTNFDSKPGFLLTQKMKTIISSAFAQITFGLNIHTLSKFNHIFITPSPYSYKHNNVLLNGDVNLRTKRVNLSWPTVKKGFEINDDALNLAIHEFGHCLIFENAARSYLSRFFEKDVFEEWKKQAHYKYQKIQKRENVVLRDYAGTNLIELFSVALETFFEKPHEFYAHEPELYLITSKLLKQDPRITSNPLQIK